ncbi:MAG TPA: bifunctional [glutamate--ammonia ligase]-adenylyl-L-tyrosine phosphorylase/[glutamate--ammonia-ligase] adenylyltransferase [Luteimonas sp.]|nr:bifunctional [glutamate--ammonia ligase]-adenylyl-L-tyrosine phosphorylase/[glutamate--ammonia-ligase] adenylyltransferase [Luteimonas sp.]
MADPSTAPSEVTARLLAALPSGARTDPADAARLERVAMASDFAIDTFRRDPGLLAELFEDPCAPAGLPPVLDPETPGEWPRLLRRYRAAESTRLVWRDVLGHDSVDETLAGSTRLADACLQAGLAAVEGDMRRRHGRVLVDGREVRLVVFGLGKLGGGELNFSSDVDLVYGYESGGHSDGARSLAADDYFARVGQALARLLDEPTADGFCHRVDLRLRPYGNAGRVAMSFAAIEQYAQREGRDWERYAWQKARPVAGDVAAGERLLVTLRPFVYRRYLDYGALDGLRTMKSAIAAEVARQDRIDDIKRGPGGIREIEFFAQALQLVRGGREPALRERRLLPALEALRRARHVGDGTTAALVAAYRFLRRLENRLQMVGDAQTHALPGSASARERLARGLDYPGWPQLAAELAVHREAVATEFAALLALPGAAAAVPSDLAGYWRGLPDDGGAVRLAAAGFGEAAAVDAVLCDFARSPSVRELSDAARARLDRVMPVLLQATATLAQPHLAIRRLLALLQNVLRRASYLALLDEQPVALARLGDLVTRSAFLAERVAMHPLLLDELLDARIEGPMPGRAALDAECAAVVARDTEAALYALNEIRQAASFRTALATLDGRQRAVDSTRQLAWLAEAVVAAVVAIARRELHGAHGAIPEARFAVIGYGSLGGSELGVGSDLDLVFLYDAPAQSMSDGARALDAARWHARLAQKVVALLGTVTGAGRLYDVDIRLRPDGASGLLVSSMASFDDYQRERAWTWEHQALVRARPVAGDTGLCAAFQRVRDAALARPRDVAALQHDVAAMRAKMRAELDRSSAGRFDLKQGRGGLVDLEFLVQMLVLREAAAHPPLLRQTSTPCLLDALAGAGVLGTTEAAELRDAHAALLASALDCTLDRRTRVVAESVALARHRAAITAALAARGLVAATDRGVPSAG